MGYSTQRKTAQYAKEVYGICRIPSHFLGHCLAPEDDNYAQNVLPEIFYGFYDADHGGSGFDIGIRTNPEGKWVAFAYGGSLLAKTNAREPFKKIVSPEDIVYMRAWIQGGTAYLNVSRTGYHNTDLLDTPFAVAITDSIFSGRATGAGYKINRELAIANGTDVSDTYDTSGCYMLNAEFLQHGYVTMSGDTYIWTDETSARHLPDDHETFSPSSENRILRIRKDYTQVDTSKIKLISRTNAANGATEKVSIDFRTNIYDINRDGVVNGLDLAIAQRYYRAEKTDPDWYITQIADVDNDGVVDIFDMLEIQAHYTN